MLTTRTARRARRGHHDDAEGNEISHSERSDKRGRIVEAIVFNQGRLILHVCDSYDETSDGRILAAAAQLRRTEVTPKTETLGNVTTCIEWGGPSAEMELEDPKV